MTSAWGGGEGGTPKADDSTDKLRECVRDKGGGQKIRKFCGRHLSMAPKGEGSHRQWARAGRLRIADF